MADCVALTIGVREPFAVLYLLRASLSLRGGICYDTVEGDQTLDRRDFRQSELVLGQYSLERHKVRSVWGKLLLRVMVMCWPTVWSGICW